MLARITIWILVLSVLSTIGVLVSLPAEKPSLLRDLQKNPILQELIAGSHSMSVADLSKGCDIESIELERTPCYGSCPIYKVVLNRNATARYFGDAYVSRLGIYDGTLEPKDFAHLCQLAREISFQSLESEYIGGGWTDSSGAMVSVTRLGSTKKVFDYSETAPSGLWAFENSIDAVASRIKWKQVAEEVR